MNEQQTPRSNNGNSASQSPTAVSTLTQERATESNAIQIPQIELPKGGGALKGIDEKFEVNAANGTASFSIPLPITPGRNGFSPSLSLSYNSGGGNSPYGLGWSVGYPMIQRKTDTQLPRYRDGIEEDTFMFSGAEDLVPLLEWDGQDWEKKQINNADYHIIRYRPRVEGRFAKIERIHRKEDDQTYWKVTTRENVSTFFGLTSDARIAKPKDEKKEGEQKEAIQKKKKIYGWLPEFSYDDKGNWIKYEYKPEDLAGVANELHEANRYNGLTPFTNRYLKRVKYGNRVAWYANDVYAPTLPEEDAIHFFELVMDYGEHRDINDPDAIPIYEPEPEKKWNARPDAFSSYRSGFEIRTYRRCHTILLFHHFEDEEQFVGTADIEPFGKEYLVRSLKLKYADSNINQSNQTEVSYLAAITQKGYVRKAGEYFVKSLPPLEFDYQQLDWNTEVRVVDQESIANAPVGLSNSYQWIDLYGEGINGILTEQAEAWYYKSNLGDTDEDHQVKFTAAQKVMNKPSFLGVNSGVLSLQDLEADGNKQVVVNSAGIQGYFELTENNTYLPFQAFEAVANVDVQAPNVRMLDLNGDGQPEIVMTEENVFTWYASKGRKGYERAEQSLKPFDEEKGPALVFADTDQQESIFLADMSGDGLTDIVRVRNGEICYWANMGYGKFSAKINMSNAPLFDYPDQFNPQYIQFADVSGTGATDIIYLGRNKFKAYINLSGNAWSDAHEIDPFFPIDSNTQLSVIDLLGTGTSCIVWSSDLPSESHAPMRYMDLMNSKKPHVLKKYSNNFGKETTLEYKSSTYYYLKDKLAGKPWATKLPFPVQVIAKSIVEDKITDVRFTAEYMYHHGYYDHEEREFRGFGMVEQKDTEEYENWRINNDGNRLEQSQEHYQPPTLTKTWFHTGAFLDRERLLTHFEKEYWYQEYHKAFPDNHILDIEKDYQLPDAKIVANQTIAQAFDINSISAEEYREALRACKGMMLRQEIFALDAPKENPSLEARQTQLKPYTVATHNCHIQLLQPRAENRYASFIVTESEAITINYERNETDPRVTHNLNIQIDALGNVLESAAVVYPRKNKGALTQIINKDETLNYQRGDEKTTYINSLKALQQAQAKTHIIYTQNRFVKYNDGVTDFDDIDLPHAYRLRLPYETKTFELTGFTPADSLFKLLELENALSIATEIGYHESPVGSKESRLIEHVKSRYLDDDLNKLAFGFFDTLGLPHENYQLAYTPELLTAIFGDKIPDAATLLEGKGKFHLIDNNWWIRSGFTHFKENAENLDDVKDRFYSPIKFEDPFGATTKVKYDNYYLMLKSSEDALQNRIEVKRFNFRSLSPIRMKDINDNLSEILLDELGLVKAMAVMGKGNEADSLEGLTEYTTQAEKDNIQNYFSIADSDDLQVAAKALLQKASTRFVYNFHRYRNSVQLQQKQLDNKPKLAPCEQIKYMPTVVGSIAREQHANVQVNSPIQLSFEYSDGMGNIAMTKAQAEPGEALQLTVALNCDYTLQTVDTGNKIRWIGNGRTVLNNKGNPVKQYEPYFSVNPFYEDNKELVERGITPIIYYDAVGRNVRTELPDGTFTKVEFDSWHQRHYDQNDTVKDSQWYNERIGGQLGNKKKKAAEKAAWHHNTPSILHLDALARPILSITHNRVYERDNSEEVTNTKDELYSTQIELDIEGNAQKVIDAKGNAVMEYAYSMLGHRVYQNSMDAGERWMLNNTVGNPLRRWDTKGHIFSFEYDELQRPVEIRVQGGANNLNHVYEVIEYGDRKNQPLAERNKRKAKNQLGQEVIHKDTSGVLTFIEYDFKGNLIKSNKQLLRK